MSKNFTYLRINKNNKKYTEEQENGIINYVKKHNMEIFHNIEVEINTPSEEKNILELLKSCKMNSTLIVYDLNVFGRTIERILEIIKFLLENFYNL